MEKVLEYLYKSLSKCVAAVVHKHKSCNASVFFVFVFCAFFVRFSRAAPRRWQMAHLQVAAFFLSLFFRGTGKVRYFPANGIDLCYLHSFPFTCLPLLTLNYIFLLLYACACVRACPSGCASMLVDRNLFFLCYLYLSLQLWRISLGILHCPT